MGLDRSTIVKPNVAANVAATGRKDIYYTLKPDSVSSVRFLPTTDEGGMLFYVTNNHFKLLDPSSDDGKKGLAVGCGRDHGDEDRCFICDLQEALKKTGKKAEGAIAKQIAVSVRYSAQVLINEQVDGEWVYGVPKIIGLSGGMAGKISQLLANMKTYKQPLFNDIAKGQDLLIKRIGSGITTKYELDRSGMETDLDVVKPGWDKNFIDDMWEALGLKVFTYDEQKKIAMHTFGDAIDWAGLGLA